MWGIDPDQMPPEEDSTSRARAVQNDTPPPAPVVTVFRCNKCFGPTTITEPYCTDCKIDAVQDQTKVIIKDIPGWKETNPKDAVGIRKASMSCIPAPFLMALGGAMAEGAFKYGRHNYRASGVRVSVYYDAFMRHMTAYWEGEDIDPDSGVPHMIKAAACIAVLYDSWRWGNLVDDRPPSYPNGWQEEFNQMTQKLLQKYPDPVKPYTIITTSYRDGKKAA